MGCRHKTTHPQGVVAKINWENVGGHPYTGMFKGADTGYVRLSSAAAVNYDKPTSVPNMGVKLLRDDHDSANFVA